MVYWKKFLNTAKIRELLEKRALGLRLIKDFFLEEGFLEVDTPILQPFPNLDSNIKPFKLGKAGWLHTSPELSMKKLLAAGSGDIFQISHVFREEKASPFHRNEFTMVEWYETGVTYHKSMDRCEALISSMAEKIYSKQTFLNNKPPIDFKKPWERISVKEAFWEFGRISLEEIFEISKLKAVLKEKKIYFMDSEDWESLYFRIFLDVIEPNLKGPLFLLDFPAEQANMAKLKKNDPNFAERFECYISGLELANGYTELADPEEQKNRLQKHSLKTGFPPDKDLLIAMQTGFPECSGVALGVDRLLMIMFNFNDITEIVLDLKE